MIPTKRDPSVTPSASQKCHCIDQLPKVCDPGKNLALVLIHGFPERYIDAGRILGPLINKWISIVGGIKFTHGFKRVKYCVIALDMLGYDQTDKSPAIGGYMLHINPLVPGPSAGCCPINPSFCVRDVFWTLN